MERARSRSPGTEEKGVRDRSRSPGGGLEQQQVQQQEIQKPANFREGDWMCGCGAHNYASKHSCFKCGLGKDGKAAEWGAQGAGGHEKPDNFRQGDWMCTCSAHNYASKNMCHKCGIVRHMVPGSFGGNQPDNFRPGDWMCPCGAHNYANKSMCHKCGMAKAMAAMGGMGGGMGMGGMGMGGMGMGMGGQDMLGMMGGGMMGGGSGLPANFRPGDWMCPCGQHNFASKANCHKCGTPKPAQNQGMQGGMQAGMGMQPGMGAMAGMGGMMGQYGAATGMEQYGAAAAYGGGYGGGYGGQQGYGGQGQGQGQVANFRAGDWMCTCGGHNYASKTNCHKCGTPKETGAVGGGGGGGGMAMGGGGGGGVPPNFRPGDWMCSCGAHNYASKTNCHKCGTAKP